MSVGTYGPGSTIGTGAILVFLPILEFILNT